MKISTTEKINNNIDFLTGKIEPILLREEKFDDGKSIQIDDFAAYNQNVITPENFDRAIII